MFTIGEFARLGRVSVRILRHYDATGLLRPIRVDPATGYRYYTAAQLTRLNRVIALKDLGFTLSQVGEILGEKVTPEELRGMLRLRQAELETTMKEAASRLAHVEARLRSIETEGHMPTDDVVIKRLPGVRVAELTGLAADFETLSPVIDPLYAELFGRLSAAGAAPSGPGVAYYEDVPDGGILVHAGVEVAAPLREASEDAGEGEGEASLRVLDLPPVATAATIVHRGPMGAVLPTVQALGRWIDTHGYRSTGHPREISLECPADRNDWVTELQEPVVPA